MCCRFPRDLIPFVALVSALVVCQGCVLENGHLMENPITRESIARPRANYRARADVTVFKTNCLFSMRAATGLLGLLIEPSVATSKKKQSAPANLS